MARRVHAWLRRKLRLGGKTQPQETTSRDPLAPPSIQKGAPPAPYDALNKIAKQPLSSIEVRESIETTEGGERFEITEGSKGIETTGGSDIIEILRARNPPARLPPGQDTMILRPPGHWKTPFEAARGAAATAVIGMLRSLDESDPSMVAARTAQAIAVAVSTSRSYAAFVAAVTAAESCAYLDAEYSRFEIPHERCDELAKNAVRAAAEKGLAADAGTTPIGAWPFNIHDADSAVLPPRTAHHCPTCSCRP